MLGTLPRRHERQFVGTGSPPPSYLQGVRSGATLFLLAAVGILAALALADALRKDDAQPAAEPGHDVGYDHAAQAGDPSRHPSQRGGLGLRPLLGPGLPAPFAAPPAHGRRRRPERGRRGRLPLSLPRGRRTARLRAREPGRQARVSRRRDRLRRPRRPYARGSRPRRAPASQRLRVRPEHPAPYRRSTTWRASGCGVPMVAMTISARDLEPQYLLANFDGHTVRAVAASFLGPYRHLFLSNDGALLGAEDGTVITRTGPDDRPAAGRPRRPRCRLLPGRPLGRRAQRDQHLPRRASRRRSAGAHHPPADPRARPRLGARYFRDFSRSTNTSMNPGPSTSTPTWQFGSLPDRSQRST